MDTTPNDTPEFPTDHDGAGMDEPRRSSDATDLITTPDAPTADTGHKDETYYNANPPSGDEAHDALMRDQAGNPMSPQASPSAYPDYTRGDVNAKRAHTTTDAVPSDDPSVELVKKLPTQENWEKLGVGSRIERTENGWKVVQRYVAGGGFQTAEARSINRAFQLLGSQYNTDENGRRTLVDVNGDAIPPEADELA